MNNENRHAGLIKERVEKDIYFLEIPTLLPGEGTNYAQFGVQKNSFKGHPLITSPPFQQFLTPNPPFSSILYYKV